MSSRVVAYDMLIPMPEDGASLYTWMKYADDAQGNGMSDSPDGKAYVGFAYNKPTPVESDDPADYKWQKVTGDQGEKGDKGDQGEKGESTITMFIDKSSLFVPVDNDTGAVLTSKTFSLVIRFQSGESFVPLGSSSISSLTCTPDKSSSSTSISSLYVSDSLGGFFAVVVSVPSGQLSSYRVNEISFALTHVYAGTVYGKVQLVYVQRGTVGPAGATIPQPYSCGWWDVLTDYVVKNNYAPMVAWPKSANPLYYVRTTLALDDIPRDAGGYPLDPAADYAAYNGSGAWILFEKYAAIHAVMMMANWARFGNAEGGVFWAHYLFSSMGIPSGEDKAVDHSLYADSDTPIFDETTSELTGAFIPNLFLDFKYGGIKCNRFSEPFVRMSECFKRINVQDSHNVCVPPTVGVPKILFMPDPADIVSLDGDVLVDSPFMVDGTNSCILLQNNNGIQTCKASKYISWNDDGAYDIRRYITILCADGRISRPESYRVHENGTVGYYPDGGYTTAAGDITRYTDIPAGMFYVNGMFTKFLILAPGDMVRLKSCYIPYDPTDGRDTIDVLAWFVENGDNFDNVPLSLTMRVCQYYDDVSDDSGLVTIDGSEDVLFDCTSNSDSFYGKHTAYGSKYVAGIKGGDALDVTFVLEDSETIEPVSI